MQVIVTAQARTIELATCYVLQPSSVMITVPGDVKQALLERLNKYIFFGDEVSQTPIQTHLMESLPHLPGMGNLNDMLRKL